MANNKIFIIVPVYKVEAYLERCIKSILNQTYQCYELILVDDGSPDNCPAICDRYAAEHENITVIHQENGGLSAARNAGIEYALKKGEPAASWITFIDSDDFIHPQYLEYLYRAAEESHAQISCCSYIRTCTSELSKETVPFIYAVLSPEQFWCKDRTNALITCAKLYLLSYWEDVRFPVGKLHEDEFTTYKVLFQCDAITVLNAPLYYYYFNSNSITHTAWSPKRLDGLDALEAQVAYFSQNQFHKAKRESVSHLFQHCIKHVMYIRHLSPKYDHLLKDVRHRHHQAFLLYVHEVGLKKAIGYWYFVRIKTPMKRVLEKESAFSFLKRKIKKKLHLS